MATFSPGQAVSLDGSSYLTVGNISFGADYPRFYCRVSFRMTETPPAGGSTYRYIVSHVNKFYIRLYINQHQQTYLQILFYTNTGNYIYLSNIQLDQAALDGTVGDNPHIQNDPITAEFYWDGNNVWAMVNGWGNINRRFVLTGDHAYENVGTLAIGTYAASPGTGNFQGAIDDVVIGNDWPWDESSDCVSHRFTWCRAGDNLGEDTSAYTHKWTWDSWNYNDEMGDWDLSPTGSPSFVEGMLGTWAGESVVMYRQVPLLKGAIRNRRLRGRVRG